MAKFILGLFLLSSLARADFLGFGAKEGFKSRIPPMVEKLKAIDMASNPAYEDTFNQAVKMIENGVEEEKLFCSGESADAQGRTLPKEQKQLCFRELKTHYVEAVGVIFDMKKKYLSLLHNRHVEKLSEIQNKIKADIEKNF